MASEVKNPLDSVVTQAEQVELGRAGYSLDLSSVGVSESLETFHATWDRVSFLNILDVVLPVLESQGFSKNFENIIACFDSLILGVRVRAATAQKSGTAVQAKTFMPCLQFDLPNTGKQGQLLKKFYSEIESYEAELARLRTAELTGPKSKDANREQLKKSVDRLTEENSKLQSKIKDLTEQLAWAMRSQASTNRALESQNIIPPQLKPAVVREISLKSRTLLLKSGRTSFSVPLALMSGVPQLGEHCLVNLINEQIVAVLCYEAKSRPFVRQMGEVLYVEERACKIRSATRRTFRWEAQADWEVEQLHGLKRGAKVILFLFEGVLVKLSAIIDQDTLQIANRVYEKQTQNQIEAIAAQHAETSILKKTGSDR